MFRVIKLMVPSNGCNNGDTNGSINVSYYKYHCVCSENYKISFLSVAPKERVQ
jgi:hypothetical protein